MHLNCHSPHAVIFRPPKYGGFSLPDLNTDQGYGQLWFFLGHCRLNDEVGTLIKIATSHFQLHVGSATHPVPSICQVGRANLDNLHLEVCQPAQYTSRHGGSMGASPLP
jgi:hypothetical protein